VSLKETALRDFSILFVIDADHASFAMPYRITTIPSAATPSTTLAQVVSLRIDLFSTIVDPSPISLTNELLRWLKLKRNQLFVVVDKEDGLVLGYLQATYSTIVSISELATSPNKRRQGIGAALLSAALAFGARQKLYEASLLVSTDNLVAIKLYEKFNFTKSETVKSYYRNGGDALKLHLSDLKAVATPKLVTSLNASSDSPFFPVVISVPHGGAEDLSTIPNRTSGCFEPDWNSAELAAAIHDAFDNKPAMTTLNLIRSKCDGNRSSSSACECLGLGLAAETHAQYHSSITKQLKACVEAHGFALLLDLHGQSHRPATELGYLVTSTDLLNPTLPDTCVSSLSNLVGSERSLEDLVRGTRSLGCFLEELGEAVTPSPLNREPVSKQALDRAASKASEDTTACTGPPSAAASPSTYFWGGYTARRYGGPAAAVKLQAKDDPLDALTETWTRSVSAIQLETSWACREDAACRLRFATALRSAVESFIKANFNK